MFSWGFFCGEIMIKLKFMVVPEELAKDAYVEDPVCVSICDPKALLSKGLLGDSGINYP